MSSDPDLYVVVPSTVDDPRAPSGGNRYDRAVCDGLVARGWRVHERHVEGDWPRPDERSLDGLARVLAAVPDDGLLLADGLVVCGAPEVVVPHTDRLRLLVLVHLPLADETGLPPDLAADLHTRERATLRAAAAVVATGRRTASRLVEAHGIEAARVFVVCPGTDFAPVAPGTDGATRLLCVASLTPRKGHDVLVEALTRVASAPWTVDCAGPLSVPAHVRSLRRRIDCSGLGGRVRLLGPRTGRALAELYAAADLVVLASRAEPYGMVITEALARAVPVLATDVDGIPDALGRTRDGRVPGLLVRPDDPAALAAGLRAWFTDPGLRAESRAAALVRRGMLASWDETTRQLATVLRHVRVRR